MSWISIERGRWGAERMPDDVVRVSKRTMALSPNIAETIQAGRRSVTTPQGVEYEKVNLGIEVDPESKQIRLAPNSVNGFTWTGRADKNNIVRVQKPSGIKKLDLPIGDYTLVDREQLVFKLAEGLTS